MENNCLICKDACPGLLIYILVGYWRFASRSFVNKTITFVDILYQTFACTCFLYYNLCLCKSFKERAPEESASKVSHPIREAASPHLRVQRYAFSTNWQNISRLFSKKDAFYAPIHYIYNTRAKEKKMGLMGLIFNGTQRHEDTKILKSATEMKTRRYTPRKMKIQRPAKAETFVSFCCEFFLCGFVSLCLIDTHAELE